MMNRDHRIQELTELRAKAEFIQAKGRGTLTSQERKAVRLKIEGKTNVEIYNELFRPEPYKSHIGVAMVAYWRRLGIKYEKWREKHGK